MNEKYIPYREEKKDKTIPHTKGKWAENPAFPIVNDPPVPNRAHTEMRAEYPPEFPEK